MVERLLCKQEAKGSIPLISNPFCCPPCNEGSILLLPLGLQHDCFLFTNDEFEPFGAVRSSCLSIAPRSFVLAEVAMDMSEREVELWRGRT